MCGQGGRKGERACNESSLTSYSGRKGRGIEPRIGMADGHPAPPFARCIPPESERGAEKGSGLHNRGRQVRMATAGRAVRGGADTPNASSAPRDIQLVHTGESLGRRCGMGAEWCRITHLDRTLADDSERCNHDMRATAVSLMIKFANPDDAPTAPRSRACTCAELRDERVQIPLRSK